MIERLYVHNFRSFENFTLDFASHHSVVMIGKNGTGKSTVLHCLKLFQNICRGSNRVRNLISASDFTQHRTDLPLSFDVDLTLSDKQFKYSVSFEWPSNFLEGRIKDESLSVDGHKIFTRHQAQTQLTGGAAFGIDWHIVALPVINERPGERAIQDIKTFFANMILIAPIPTNMTGFSEEPSMELQTDAANYASCLRSLLEQKPAAYSVFDSYVKKVIPDFSSIENVSRGENGREWLTQPSVAPTPHAPILMARTSPEFQNDSRHGHRRGHRRRLGRATPAWLGSAFDSWSRKDFKSSMCLKMSPSGPSPGAQAEHHHPAQPHQ